MNTVLARYFLLGVAAWHLSMARGQRELPLRVELAENPFLPIAGLLVGEDQGALHATLLSDFSKPMEASVSESHESCEQGQLINVTSKKIQIPIAQKGFFRVCLRPKGEPLWQTFSFIGEKTSDVDFSISAIKGLPEKESTKRILNMFLPFESAKEVYVGLGHNSRCNEDLAVVDPHTLFTYDLGRLGGKSSEVFLCFSGKKQDGSLFDVLLYSFKYSCTSRSGECQGSGLGRDADVQLALQTRSPEGFEDRNEALESWLKLGYADAEQAKILEKMSPLSIQQSVSWVPQRD
ncbi:MAG: hypothetical protein WCI18_12915 [Pseudomonadota bacterium]